MEHPSEGTSLLNQIFQMAAERVQARERQGRSVIDWPLKLIEAEQHGSNRLLLSASRLIQEASTLSDPQNREDRLLDGLIDAAMALRAQRHFALLLQGAPAEAARPASADSPRPAPAEPPRGASAEPPRVAVAAPPVELPKVLPVQHLANLLAESQEAPAPAWPAPETPAPDADAALRAKIEKQARDDHREYLGKRMLVTRMSNAEMAVDLPVPWEFEAVDLPDALVLAWEGDRLKPRLRVEPVRNCPPLADVIGPYWLAGHQYGLDGGFYPSLDFSPSLSDWQAPAAAPESDEEAALAAHARQVGQTVEAAEIHGLHDTYGEEVIRMIPPARVRVAETPREEILRRVDGALRPMWRIELLHPDPALALFRVLRINAPSDASPRHAADALAADH